MAWSSSNRRSQLPANWSHLVAQTKTRAHGLCEGISLNGEMAWHVDDCDGLGRECDHHQRGDDHSLANLRWLSPPCHKRKTQHESNQGNRSAKHPREQHPGLTGPNPKRT